MTDDVSLIVPTPTDQEVVISDRVVSNEFIVTNIQENPRDRFVRATIEFGPFTEVERPDGTIETRGNSTKKIVVWDNADYDAIAATWTNADLIAKIKTILASQ